VRQGSYASSAWVERLATQRPGVEAALRLGNRHAEAFSRSFLAGSLEMLGRLDEAYVEHRAALAIYEALDDHHGQANVHVNAGPCLEWSGRVEEALAHAEHALALFRSVGRARGIADSLNAIGWYACLLGRCERGLASCRDALAMCELELPASHDLMAFTLDSIGYAHKGLGQIEEAAAAYSRAVELFRLADEEYFLGTTLVRLGDLYEEAGQPERAQACWRDGWQALDGLGHADDATVRAKLDAHR
jgi:tetratricopeptide (TPR) repeat protein